MIEAQDLHKRFGAVQAVAGVSFRAESGRVTGLLGANGAGKTTTLRLLCGLLSPDRGRPMVGGHDAARPGSRKASAARSRWRGPWSTTPSR